MRKQLTLTTTICCVLVLCGCKQSQAPAEGNIVGTATMPETADNSASPAADIRADGNTCTYGSHTYTMEGSFTAEEYNRNATATVTFTNVPASYQEFEAVYTQFLGLTPHGAAAMMPMAMEMFRRNRDEGQRCLELLCWLNNVNSVTSQLKNKFSASQYSPQDDSYIQPYLSAAVLKGATPDNAYTPDYPYTVQMRASVNSHRELTMSGGGTVVYIYVMGKGWDTEQRSVEVILPTGRTLHQVFNCPSLYTQCKQIRGDWPGLR